MLELFNCLLAAGETELDCCLLEDDLVGLLMRFVEGVGEHFDFVHVFALRNF